MYSRYVLATVMVIVCVMLSACQKQNDALATNDSVVTNSGAIESQGSSFDIHPAIGFSGYREYIAFFQKSTAQTPTKEEQVPISDKMHAYIQTVRNESQTLMIPYHSGKPVTLRDVEGYNAITIMDEELYGFLWTWFYINVDEKRVTITLSELSAENSALASRQSCSEFIAAIAPEAPNVNNYREKTNYHLIFEDNVVIDGVTTSVLIQQTKDGVEYISFIVDGYLVVISAPTDTITAEWLCDFSLAAFPK